MKNNCYDKELIDKIIFKLDEKYAALLNYPKIRSNHLDILPNTTYDFELENKFIDLIKNKDVSMNNKVTFMTPLIPQNVIHASNSTISSTTTTLELSRDSIEQFESHGSNPFETISLKCMDDITVLKGIFCENNQNDHTPVILEEIKHTMTHVNTIDNSDISSNTFALEGEATTDDWLFLPNEDKIIADKLKENGYNTKLIVFILNMFDSLSEKQIKDKLDEYTAILNDGINFDILRSLVFEVNGNKTKLLELVKYYKQFKSMDFDDTNIIEALVGSKGIYDNALERLLTN